MIRRLHVDELLDCLKEAIGDWEDELDKVEVDTSSILYNTNHFKELLKKDNLLTDELDKFIDFYMKYYNK